MKKTSSLLIRNLGFLFSMILFLMFILCSVFIVLIGSQVCQNIQTRTNDSFYSGTALGYISNKIRQSDAADCINVRHIDSSQVLVLTSQYHQTVYETWIYTKDGFLMELFSERDSGLTTDDGLTIMESAPVDFTIEESDGRQLLSIILRDTASHTFAKLSLRSNQKGDSSYE